MLQDFSHFKDAGGIEAVDRLVKYENARVCDESNGNCKPLFHAQRIILDFCGIFRIETDFLQKVF